MRHVAQFKGMLWDPTLLVTGLQGRKWRFGRLKNTESTVGTLEAKQSYSGMPILTPSLILHINCSQAATTLTNQGQMAHLERIILAIWKSVYCTDGL